MKTRTLVVLGVVLVALVVAATAPSWWSSEEDGPADAKLAADALGIDGIDLDEVDELRVRRAGNKDAIVVVRDGTEWTVAGSPADQDRVDAWLDAIRALADADATLVSRNAERHADLGLTVKTGSLVTISLDGGQAHELFVGQAGDVPDTFYARAADADPSWLVTGDLFAALPAAATDLEPAETGPADA